MKVSRALAQVNSLRKEVAKTLQSASDPKIKWDAGTRLQELTTLKLILLTERVEELERELTKQRLQRRYNRGA